MSPQQPDTDGDLIPDGAELNFYGTDPYLADSDGDGISDGAELFTYGTDPLVPDLFTQFGSPLINYQGRLTDDVGVAVSDTVDIKFSIYDGETGGAAMWSESQLVDVNEGIYNVIIGGSTAIPPQILSLPEIYLELVVDGETLTPRQKITAVSHAVNSSRIEGKRLEVGNATLDVNPAASSATVHVDFDKSFTSPPKVTVTGLDGQIGVAAFVFTRIYNVTATGFDVEWKSLSGASATGSAGFGYYAFGE